MPECHSNGYCEDWYKCTAFHNKQDCPYKKNKKDCTTRQTSNQSGLVAGYVEYLELQIDKAQKMKVEAKGKDAALHGFWHVFRCAMEMSLERLKLSI